MREFGDIVRKFEQQRDQPFALATLVRSHGSSYRRPGARMMIAADGSCVGSLSGGCLEEEVIERARRVLHHGDPAWMEFDTRRRFGCHGAVEILVEHPKSGVLEKLAACFHARQCASLATYFSREAGEVGTRFVGEFEPERPDVFIQHLEPALQLLVIGEGPDNTALRSFCDTLGWRTVPIESATELSGTYDAWTAAIVKTHNYGRDCAALRALLPLGLRYIGLLGPRRRRDQLLGDLFDSGLDSGLDISENLFGPAGLDLGSSSPEEIALSSVAEIQAVFTGGSRQSLRDRRTPIHAPAPASLAAARN
jgi:xanthine/CO dehydrogenase XdhC/CoxF family maturation factor